MINSFAYNIPFVSIFMLMIAAIITPLLPEKKTNTRKIIVLCNWHSRSFISIPSLFSDKFRTEFEF